MRLCALNENGEQVCSDEADADHDQTSQNVISTDLYVSTDLWWFEQMKPHRLSRDFTWHGQDDKPRTYRRLTAQYYAWLKAQVDMVVTLELQGKVSRADLDETEEKFERIECMVKARVPDEKLKAAACPKNYQPPRTPEIYLTAYGE